MKKLTIFLLIGILILGVVVAETFSGKNLELNEEKVDKLIKAGYNDYTATDYSKDGLIQRCLEKNIYIESFYEIENITLINTKRIPKFNTCSDWVNNTIKLNKWEKDWIENNLYEFIIEEEKIKKIKEDETIVKIKEIKQ